VPLNRQTVGLPQSWVRPEYGRLTLRSALAKNLSLLSLADIVKKAP
jgi:hypothetical protein